MSDETAAKLRQMRDAVDDQVDALANSIVQVEEQIVELAEQADALETEITTPDEASAVDLLENTILIDKGGDYVEYGPTFGLISWSPKGNLTDWAIKIDTTAGPVTIYIYTSGDYPDLDQWVSDYAFGNDYLTRPLVSSGLGTEASYGIYPSIASLNTGKEYLDNNKDKVEASEDVFNRYIS